MISHYNATTLHNSTEDLTKLGIFQHSAYNTCDCELVWLFDMLNKDNTWTTLDKSISIDYRHQILLHFVYLCIGPSLYIFVLVSACWRKHPSQVPTWGGRTKERMPSTRPGRCFTCTDLPTISFGCNMRQLQYVLLLWWWPAWDGLDYLKNKEGSSMLSKDL